MKFLVFGSLLALSLSSFAKPVPVENVAVREALTSAMDEVSKLKCENHGSDYKYNDPQMLGFFKGDTKNNSLELYVEEASQTTLILMTKDDLKNSTGRLVTISFNLSDDLREIISASYVVETISSQRKNVGNILKPKYENVTTKKVVMNTICEVVPF